MSISALELPELLEAIATYLDSPDLISAACVCKIWSSVFIARVWHTLNNSHLLNPMFKLLPLNGHLVRSLTIVGNVDGALMEHCRLLDVLDLTLAPLDLHALENLVQKFPRLRRLTLNGCYGQGLAWLQILQKLKHLECLRFLDDQVTDDLVEVGGENDVSESDEEEEEEEEEHSQEHDDDPEYLFDHDSFGENDDQDRLPFDYLGDLLVARARTLTELSLRGCSLRGFDLWEDLSSPSITPPILALRRLSLAETSVKSSDVVVLLKQCPELKELDLSGNFEPSWDSFPWSILHATQLTRLNLSQMCIDNKQLAQALLDCKGLASLIASQSNIQDTVLDTVVESLDGLVELDVSWCPEISEAAVARMLQRAATLKSLKLSWCAGVQSTIFRVPWACTRLEILEAQGLDRPPKEGRIGPNNVHDRVKQDEGEEEDELECDRAMFVQLSSLTELHRLVVGSSTTIISVSHGFGLMRWLSKLQELVLVGDDAHPMRLEELRLVAQFPHLSSFEFSLGLVDSAGQTALAGMKPSLKQQEQEIYF
ncbi:MAG: hypothetical protein BYD32DRAFT_412855 [Podila humilis]|nr:MAG: hypothetical protein BYD32DRAFT_412855 [Podila humilis]